ncbi:YciI family protein [uncultured Algoriphagus sp.]|uniref:YciI family protein n=1 Tax=uncultured Algoriphagus sp. TaxID=417365 RepID=UPI0030EE6139|tara:strand:+ start:109192 stop:109647 length:456 start_codon:yes stop_codon:yes gene_type:complete
MKNIVLLLVTLLSFTFVSQAQNDAYDSALAGEVGADEYGMKKYVIAFLYRGDKVQEYTEEQRAEIQAGHMANINRLAEEGKLVMAGPFFGNEELRGLFFFAVESLEEAQKLTASDPAIEAGVLKMDLKEWYGSAALMLMSDLHSKVAKVEI